MRSSSMPEGRPSGSTNAPSTSAAWACGHRLRVGLRAAAAEQDDRVRDADDRREHDAHRRAADRHPDHHTPVQHARSLAERVDQSGRCGGARPESSWSTVRSSVASSGRRRETTEAWKIQPTSSSATVRQSASGAQLAARRSRGRRPACPARSGSRRTRAAARRPRRPGWPRPAARRRPTTARTARPPRGSGARRRRGRRGTMPVSGSSTGWSCARWVIESRTSSALLA